MQSSKKLKRKARVFREIQWYSFLLPTLLCLIILTYIPMGKAIYLSFNKVSQVGFETSFVGLRNYTNLLGSARFVNAIFNTLILGVYSLISIPFGFMLAISLNALGNGKTQTFFRVTYYLPNIITGVSVVLMFRYILMKDNGLLNAFFSLFAREPVQIGWLVDQSVSKIAVTIIAAWSGVGYAMLICLAGLQSISSDIYEAADIDGAKGWRRLAYITMPNMVNTFTFLLVTGMINGLSRFNDLYMLGGAGGAPNYSLQTILMYVYQYGFSAASPNYGLSSAAAMIFFVVVFIATMFNLGLTNFGNERNDMGKPKRRRVR